MSPSLAYGTGGFSTEQEEKARAQLEICKKHKIPEVDTARLYGGGSSEKVLGILKAPEYFTITTKAQGFTPDAGKRDAMLKTAVEQFENLGVKKVRVYLLHCPDENTPIEETMDAIQEIYKQGRFEKFGLSNFDAQQVQACYDYAKKNNYVLPTVYQSNYNLVSRHNESGLFPLLRSLGFTEIQAYSPVAGGFLVKTPESVRNPTKHGRWDADSPMNGGVGKIYQTMYNKPVLMKFLEDFGRICKEYGESQVGVAYRWVTYHSYLGDGDRVIVGASSDSQLEETLVEIEKGPLDEKLVKELESHWDIIKDDAPLDNFSFAKKVLT